METRIPDPFPWPDDEVCVEFGRASYYSHKLERELKLLLLAAQAANIIQITIPTRKNINTGELEPVSETVEEYLYNETLGPLIYLYGKHDGWRDKKLKKKLFSALFARNELAHTALERHDPMHYEMPDRTELIGRLKELRFRIGIPYIIMREVRKIIEERIGITEEQLQAMLMKWSKESYEG